MKKYASLLVILLLVSCVQRKFNGIKTEQSSSKYGLFSKVESCSPTLSWSPQLDPNVTYDVQVNTALEIKGAPPEKGEIVFYKEMIASNSVQVTTPLKAGTRYLWSVRTRKITGEVSPWSTYNKSTDMFMSQEFYKNLWFGIETPEVCKDGAVETSQSATPAITNDGEDSYMTGRQLTDESLKALLDQGWGGVILRNKAYTYSQGFDKSKYAHLQGWIRQEGKDYSYDNLNIYWLAKDHENEMPCYGQGGFFVMILPPGNYVLSRVVSRDYDGTRSIRVFKDVTVTKGQITFLGDVISLVKKNLVGQAREAESFVVFDEVGLSEVKSKYPLTAAYITP